MNIAQVNKEQYFFAVVVKTFVVVPIFKFLYQYLTRTDGIYLAHSHYASDAVFLINVFSTDDRSFMDSFMFC
jgi:hypothetical protein